ncbi:MAG: mechanosensitive ion channel family protein [Clostridia bacterium]|nr:mechanosensitive ion channel family protein [Clostridia bacterium]
MPWEDIWAFVSPFTNTVLVLVIGYFLVRLLTRIISRPFVRAKFDDSLVRFIRKASKIVGYVIVFTTALATLGVPVTTLAATLSGAALAIGVALKDSLSNVAGGIILLFVPRFVTGDYIITDGDEGTVITVDLMHTTIQTVDNKQVSIPNGVLVNSHITNVSHEKTRRLDLLIPLAYEADVEAAKRVALEVVAQHPLSKSEPEAPFVRLRSYSEHTMGLTVRVWCDAADYWTLHYDLTEHLHAAFAKNGVALPYRPKAEKE